MQAGMLQLEIVAFTDEVLGHALLHGVKGFPLPLIELLKVSRWEHCRLILCNLHKNNSYFRLAFLARADCLIFSIDSGLCFFLLIPTWDMLIFWRVSAVCFFPTLDCLILSITSGDCFLPRLACLVFSIASGVLFLPRALRRIFSLASGENFLPNVEPAVGVILKPFLPKG